MDTSELQSDSRALSPETSRVLLEHQVFKTCVDATRMAMAVSDPRLPDCPLVYINPAFSELTGYEPGDVLGTNCRFLQGPETDRAAIRRIRDALVQRAPITEDIYNYRKDGSGFWNALYISPVFDESGSLIYYFASQLDVTVQRGAARQQTLRLQSVQAFATGVAHEFNNLLTVILGSLERIDTASLDDAQNRHLRNAEHAASIAGDAARKLLLLARQGEPVREAVDLNVVLEELLPRLEAGIPGGVNLRLELSPEPVSTTLNVDELFVALNDLVENAVEAMTEGGDIRMSLTLRRANNARSAASRGVELVVEDSGRGMDPFVAQRSMELFFTTKEKGRGIGLFKALQFAEAQGGRLEISSVSGSGTSVTMSLPTSE